MDLLNSSNTKLQIFEQGVSIDRTLPKYCVVVEPEEGAESKNTPNNVQNTLPSASFGSNNFSNRFAIPSDFNFEEIADADTHKISILIKKNHLERLNAIQDRGGIITPLGFGTTEAVGAKDHSDEKESIIKRLVRKFKGSEDKDAAEPIYELDIISFFGNVKNMAKDSVDDYKNRISGYIKALRNAEKSGQEALKEKLLSNLIINKYESVLYSLKYYYAVTEEQVVEFAKKCEKGLSLDYVSNFIRPIPDEIVNTIHELNKCEIFDNYVVLHYDPDKKSVAQTIAEKEEEARKKKDPILFGVISGSKKLYYIADWVDEYCNLTLNEFVDVIDANMEDLKMSEKIDI